MDLQSIVKDAVVVLFVAAVFIQLVYWLFVHFRLLGFRNVRKTENTIKPSVSIVVAAWNELENLKELLPLLENQSYPDFEIIVCDDRSYDGTYDLLWIEKPYKKVQVVRIDSTPTHFTSKKYAVTMGIKRASKNLILLTDADCRPVSEHWIEEMVAAHTTANQFVLGFSPYETQAGWLNRFIRFETLHTAIQYFSYALAKVPFMGVGRNLLYDRQLFWDSNGFAGHYNVLGGDDDLFVNENATGRNTRICTSKDSIVYTKPKQTWGEWYLQKIRHLSVGKFYKSNDKFRLGLYSLTFILSWVLFLPVFFIEPSFTSGIDTLSLDSSIVERLGFDPQNYLSNWKGLVLTTFVAWCILKWFFLGLVNARLHKTIRNRWLLVMDWAFVVYLMVFGVIVLFTRKQIIRWK